MNRYLLLAAMVVLLAALSVLPEPNSSVLLNPGLVLQLSTPTGIHSDYGTYLTHVYCRVDLPGWRLLDDADPSSFVVVAVTGQQFDFQYGKDGNHVYYGCDVLDGADPSTLELVGNRNDGSAPVKDKTHVYWADRPLEGADASTFRVVGRSFTYQRGIDSYFKDKSAVYFGPDRISGADPNTFIVLDAETQCGGKCIFNAYDRRHKYENGTVVE